MVIGGLLTCRSISIQSLVCNQAGLTTGTLFSFTVVTIFQGNNFMANNDDVPIEIQLRCKSKKKVAKYSGDDLVTEEVFKYKFEPVNGDSIVDTLKIKTVKDLCQEDDVFRLQPLEVQKDLEEVLDEMKGEDDSGEEDG